MPSIDLAKLVSSATKSRSLAFVKNICAEIRVLPLIRYKDSFTSPLISYVVRFRKASANLICFRSQATVCEMSQNPVPLLRLIVSRNDHMVSINASFDPSFVCLAC